MRVTLKGIDRLGPVKQRRVLEALALLKRDYPIEAYRHLTIQFCDRNERARLWRGMSAPPRGFFEQNHPQRAVIDQSATIRQMVRGVAATWRYVELSMDTPLYTAEEKSRAYRVSSRFAEKIADRVLGPKEVAA